MITVDAHQHLWDRGRSPYAWLAADGLAALRRDIGLSEGLARLDEAGIDATILVQADDTAADTDLMVEAAEDPRVVGVVGWVPLDRAADTARRLARRSPLLVGIRNLIHDRDDPDWLLTDPVDAGLAEVARAGLPLDVPAELPRHLENVATIADRHPDLVIVIDHLAKPPIGLADREPWWSLIAAAARRPNVVAKVSGVYAAGGDPADWSAADLQPFVDRALESFGSSRLIYGGDWPVSILGGDYRRVYAGVRHCLSGLSDAEQASIFGGNAARCYRLDPDRLQRAQVARRDR